MRPKNIIAKIMDDYAEKKLAMHEPVVLIVGLSVWNVFCAYSNDYFQIHGDYDGIPIAFLGMPIIFVNSLKTDYKILCTGNMYSGTCELSEYD